MLICSTLAHSVVRKTDTELILWRVLLLFVCLCDCVFLLILFIVLVASGSWARPETAVGTALCVRRYIGHYHRCLLDVLVQWLDRPAQPSGENLLIKLSSFFFLLIRIDSIIVELLLYCKYMFHFVFLHFVFLHFCFLHFFCWLCKQRRFERCRKFLRAAGNHTWYWW